MDHPRSFTGGCPVRVVASSAGLHWRTVSACIVREDRVAAEFETRPVVDLRVIVVTSGTYRVDCSRGGRWSSAHYHPGSVRVIAPGSSSILRWTATNDDPLESVHILLSPALLQAVADELSAPASDGGDHLHLDDPFVAAAGRAMGAALTARAPALYADSLAHTIAAHLVLANPLVPPPVSVGGLGEKGLRTVLTYMQEHLADDVKLADLAALVNVSAFHFLRLFRVATGTTPHSYLVGLRIRRGAQLLRQTTLPVGQIAVRCGYRSAGRFSEAFRRQFDASPSSYRLSIQP